uniref:Ubiquitin-like domain-containing protein n=1 Tax=Octopus bimaculoides TaxID=37653 RepID=A0A0L8GX35_OCTBM
MPKPPDTVTVKFKITSKTTAGDLKRMVYRKYNLPVEHQRLVVSHQIPKENDFLSLYDVKEGSGVFLYLVPTTKHHSTTAQYDRYLSSEDETSSRDVSSPL